MSFPRYKSYKDSGVDWLGDVPAHWEVKRLRFVAELNPSKSEISELDKDTMVSFLPMETIGEDGSLNLDREKAIREVETGYTYFRDGDVVVSKITPCFENGKGALMRGLQNGIGFGTTELIVARPRQEETNGEYLHWLFISEPFRKLGEAYMYGAGGQKRVPDDFVRNFAISFPPLSEQKSIAVFLDRETTKIDALIAEQQRLIALLVEKRQATISHAVTKGLNPDTPMKDSGIEWLGEVAEGWRISRLGFESWLRARLGWRGLKAEEYVEDGFIFLATPNIKGLAIDFENVNYINKQRYEESPEIKLQVGDVLLAKDGSTLGTVNVVRSLPRPATVNSSIAVITPNKTLCGVFLYYLFQSTYMENTIERIKGGMGVPHLFQEDLNKFYIPLPPISVQLSIATFLDRETAQLDTLTAEAQSAIALLQERCTALISAAVTGKIDVRNLSERDAA